MGWWSTCRWVGGPLSVVGGFSVVGSFVIHPFLGWNIVNVVHLYITSSFQQSPLKLIRLGFLKLFFSGGVNLTPKACNFIKKETQRFCEISKNTFFTEHIWRTASVILLKTIK